MKNCGCQVRWPGQMSYDAARQVQRELAAKRKMNPLIEQVAMVGHPWPTGALSQPVSKQGVERC